MMRRPSRDAAADLICAGVVALVACVSLLPGLSHPGIHDWDESVHLAVSRGLMDTPLSPHVFIDPMHPVRPDDWVSAGPWLHKPLFAMWLSALLMKLFGVSTGVARFGSFLGMLSASLSVFFVMKRAAGRFWAALAGASLCALPFTFELTQGYMFGDMTDTVLAGAVAGSIALLLYAVRRESHAWAAAAGVLVGIAYLTKSALGLVPLGVGLVLLIGRLTKLSKGPKPTMFLLFVVCAGVSGSWWNLYAKAHFPELYAHESKVTMSHLTVEAARADPSIVMWIRPLDAIFNEIHGRTLDPIPVSFVLLAGFWILYRALRTREEELLAVASWLWATWLVLSWAAAKVPATAWGAVGATFCAIALLLHDSWKRPALAIATSVTLGFDLLTKLWPRLPALLAPLKTHLPDKLEQTRAMPGLFEGLFVALIAALIVAPLLLVKKARRPLAVGTYAVMVLLALYKLGPNVWEKHDQMRESKRDLAEKTHTKEVGIALAEHAPKKSVQWLTNEFTDPEQHEFLNLLFWSGHMSYGPPTPDQLQNAQSKGYARWLVSPVAEPYASLDAVPPGASMRAYDYDKPQPPPDIPKDAQHVSCPGQNVDLKGLSWTKTGYERDRWVFFVAPHGIPSQFPVTFVHSDGTKEELVVTPESSLKNRPSLQNAPWFIATLLGPRRKDVNAVVLSPCGQQFALE